MTQQDIVNELNRRIAGYNITWDSIEMDADRAIMNINNNLGAKYPMMSEILVGPETRYELVVEGTPTPIFPTKYIITVVIPFIIMEVLARDEEFTTIYNKYTMDYENGLFDMFQYEFNRVPLAFRQQKDVGVFFAYDTPQRKIQDSVEKNLPVFTFKVHYHDNLDIPLYNFIIDDGIYNYGDTYEVKTYSGSLLDGIYQYTFAGWSLYPTTSAADTSLIISPGDTLTIQRELHLYAVWRVSTIIEVTDAGVATMKELDLSIESLVIPTRINNKVVKELGKDFCSNNRVKSITLPTTIEKISTGSLCIRSIIETTSVNLTFNDSFVNTVYTNILLPTTIENNSNESQGQWRFPANSITEIHVDAGCTLKITGHAEYAFTIITGNTVSTFTDGAYTFTATEDTHVTLKMDITNDATLNADSGAAYLYSMELEYNVTRNPILHLEELIIPSYDFFLGRPNITIECDAIYTQKMSTLYLPYSVKYIKVNGILGVQSINCQIYELERSSTNWVNWWTNTPSANIKWGVFNG